MWNAADYWLSRRGFGGLLMAGSIVTTAPWWLGGKAEAAAASKAARDGMPRSPPGEQGVDPQGVLNFLNDMAADNLELHSFMLYRHGHVVAEGWWWPYAAQRPHMMHSFTKSVMACGVALAMDEKRFGFDDKVVSFFKDELPAKVDDKLAAMTVRDLLTMRTGHAEETSGSIWRQISTSWVAEFFKIPVVYQPGTNFVYTSAASYMLSAIVTKTTGQPLVDYLRPRFLQPLGINDLEWDTSPGGINPGGNGLTWTTSDMIKLGAVHVQGGKWQGKQILPPDWVHAATVPQVVEGTYGYQWWVAPNKVYYANGLFCQLSFVFPEHDAVLAVTSAIDGSKHVLPHLWKNFPAAFSDSKAPATTAAALKEHTDELRLLPKLAYSTSPVAAKISGRTFQVEQNEDGVKTLKFDFTPDHCVFSQRDERGEYPVKVGLKDWIAGHTGITGNKLHHQYQIEHMPVVAGGRWLDDNTFEMTWQFVESAFRDKVVCRFNGDSMTLDRSVNINSADRTRPTLRAKIV